MEITYTQQGDYLLPNLTLPEQDKRPIGLWGQQHLRYIKRCCPIYNELVQSFAKEEGCTEQLKATNQMLWVRKTNNAVQRAREVVNAEIIYS